MGQAFQKTMDKKRWRLLTAQGLSQEKNTSNFAIMSRKLLPVVVQFKETDESFQLREGKGSQL